jgi:DNA-binding CsgD family transcriptional regulator
MYRLSQTDCARLLRLTGEFYSLKDPAQLAGALLHGLVEAIPCEFAGCHELNLATGKVVPHYHPWRPLLPCFNKEFPALVVTHPLHARLEARPARAWKESDVVSPRAFRRSAFYHTLYRPLDIDHELTARLPIESEPGGSLIVSLNRRRLDFTERDRLMLDLLLPHFLRAWERCPAAASREPHAETRVPDPARFSARVRAQAHWRLSRREIEVLYWIGEGKNHAEIGLLLGISGRTAETHALNAYQKMGVENRYAAIVALLSLERDPSNS